jgi:hypothetical protein
MICRKTGGRESYCDTLAKLPVTVLLSAMERRCLVADLKPAFGVRDEAVMGGIEHDYKFRDTFI